MHNTAFQTASFWTALCIACTLTTRTSAVPLSSLYYYPRLGNETELGPNDDGHSSPITLSPVFPFFGTNYSIAYVSEYYILHTTIYNCTDVCL